MWWLCRFFRCPPEFLLEVVRKNPKIRVSILCSAPAGSDPGSTTVQCEVIALRAVQGHAKDVLTYLAESRIYARAVPPDDVMPMKTSSKYLKSFVACKMHLKLAIFTHVNGQCGHHYQHKILIYDLQNIL